YSRIGGQLTSSGLSRRRAMATESGRRAKEGVGLGIVAGLIFGIVEIAGAAAMGNRPLMPLRMFASIILGKRALEALSMGSAAIVGIAAHLVLSALFGLVYVFIDIRLREDVQRRWTGQAVFGTAFGAVLWFINVQVIARLLYPWFLVGVEAQFVQFMVHALF